MTVAPRSMGIVIGVSCLASSLGYAYRAPNEEWKSGVNWKEPAIITPGDGNAPPSDAIVLFDGSNMNAWDGADKWIVENGYAQTGGSDARTKQSFGDCQLHIEFATPSKVESSSQGRGNSGVFLMNAFELQVLDSYQNETYFDGQCGGMYKQRPPLVNCCRKPGEWQEYDVVFHAPKFHPDGTLKRPATITVLQNGVLVQDHIEMLGDTPYTAAPSYEPNVTTGPIRLQFHGNTVKYRNIWIRELAANAN